MTSVIPRQDRPAKPSPAAGKPTASPSDSGESAANVNRQLYRDVLTNVATVSVITSPIKLVSNSYLDRRFEKLEHQALK